MNRDGRIKTRTENVLAGFGAGLTGAQQLLNGKRRKNYVRADQRDIAENLAIDVEKVTESADFKEDLDADSLDLFEMVTALEDEYEIEIPEEDLPTLKTVGDVVKYVEAHKE